MDDVELDNERHRREEQERRSKRKQNREKKSKSGHQSEKERKRREHAQRILGAQKKAQPPQPAPGRGGDAGGSSVFQSLFQERAEGFFIDLRFRNAPPRPPVGPVFVGLGLDGELTNKWTRYKARNAVENQYTWKLHSEVEFGAKLAVSAMDYEGCYENAKDDKSSAGDKRGAPVGSDPPAVHPDDESLIDWTGSLGDTAAEKLQQKQDRARAAARLAIAQGFGAIPVNAPTSSSTGGAGAGGVGGAFKLKKHHLKSRILDEKTPNFMKKTTYLTNDATSVHQFTSLAHTQSQRARDVDRALRETKTKYSEMEMAERSFGEASDGAGGARVHPSRKGVTPVWDLPLLPDVSTWGHTYTHVVLDNPPKNIASDPKRKSAGGAFKSARLQRALVADVAKQSESARMECTLWVPEPRPSSGEPARKKSKRRGERYSALQHYDLDIVPLRNPDLPPVHYVWTIDAARGHVGYHAVGSRVQLSTGRPVDVSRNSVATESDVLHRDLGAEERKRLEISMAEVDMDLAEKLEK